ncbi:fungal-specific transcription factor domain-containing protein [Aspergillus californicus]
MDPNSPPKSKRRREDRRRTARACDRCRRLKERCEGGIPCTRCVHLRRHCEFKRVGSAHTPLAEANVQELLERVMYMEKILTHKVEGISLDIDNLRRIARALEETEQEMHAPEEDPIEEEVCTIDPVEDTTTHFSGEFSYWNFSMRIKRHIEDRMHTPDSLEVSNYWRAEHLQSGLNGISVAISCCPPRHIADYLINVFFKHAETYYFYVDKRWLIDNVDTLYNDPQKFGKKSVAVVSVILTIFAIATQYAYLDSPNQKSACSGTRQPSEDELGTTFYKSAVRFLPEIIETGSLESVQACLLFAAYALPVDASGLGYIYVSLAVRLGMQNGMHREYSGSRLSAAMIDTRNRVWWTAYTLERKISIFHGRPLSTLRSDISTPLPKCQDNMLATTPYMVASILLTERLEEVLHEMFLLRTCQRLERSMALSRLDKAKSELVAWWRTLPDELHIDLPQEHEHFRCTKHLQLEYCLVRMFIGRPLLLNRESPRSSPASPDAPSGSGNGNNNYTVHRENLIQCCVQAAKEALKLCRDLRDNGPGLARTSYIEYSSCRASLLVLIAHSIQDKSVQSRAELRDGLDMIREMASAGDSARSEVALVEALERALVRLHYFNEKTAGNLDSGCTNNRLDSAYEDFKNWESQRMSQRPNNLLDPIHLWSMPHLPERPLTQSNDHRDVYHALEASTMPALRSPYGMGAFAFYSGDTPPTYPELHVLQEALADPGYRFDDELGVPNGPGCFGTPGASFAGDV